METVLLKSFSKKDMGLLIDLAKKIGIDVKIISSKEGKIDKNSEEYELRVEQNLGLIMEQCKDSPSVNYEEVLKVLNKWK